MVPSAGTSTVGVSTGPSGALVVVSAVVVPAAVVVVGAWVVVALVVVPSPFSLSDFSAVLHLRTVFTSS